MRSNAFGMPATVLAAVLLQFFCYYSVFGFANNIHTSARSPQLTLLHRLTDGDQFVTYAKPSIWVPPSQNVKQRRGNMFSIRKPGDLLDFISEDERLCVGGSTKL